MRRCKVRDGLTCGLVHGHRVTLHPGREGDDGQGVVAAGKQSGQDELRGRGNHHTARIRRIEGGYVARRAWRVPVRQFHHFVISDAVRILSGARIRQPSEDQIRNGRDTLRARRRQRGRQILNGQRP